MTWSFSFFSIAVALIAGMPVLSSAQSGATTASFLGVVRDPSGANILNASITVVNAATNVKRTVTTQDAGRFVIHALSPGIYTVRVEAPGFQPQARENVSLELGSSVESEFTMKLAGVSSEVVVAAEAPLEDIRRIVISQVVSQDQIESLPINLRNFISLSLITPGVTLDRTPQQGATATTGLTFAGQRARSNNITVDGLDNNETSSGGVRAMFSQEAVREFQVLTNSYSAEFGKASGGVVNIVTRSGSNDAAGSAFFFLRDEKLNAREYFEKRSPDGSAIDRPKAPYGQKQFGGVWGGPLRVDKTFYFLSFERLEVGANNFVNIDDREPITLNGQSIGTAADILRNAGFPVETGNVPYKVRSNQFLSKLDHVGAAGALSVRFNWADNLNENIEPWGGLVARSRGALIDSDDYMGAVSYTSAHTSKLVNEFRAQVAYRRQGVISLDPTCGGGCDGADEGGPTVEVTGVASVGRQRFTPQLRRSLRYQLLDTVSYYVNAHNVKGGIDYSYIDFPSSSLPLHFGGRFIFSALPAIPGILPAPVSAVQALALGLPAAYIQGYGVPDSNYGSQELSLFVQDDWRIGSVTLKLGVRYQNQFWPKSEYSARGLSSYSFPVDNNNIAPRLGFAWNPAGGAMSIHAAYGTFYDNQLTSLPGISNILDGADGVRTFVTRLPQSRTAWNAPGRRLPEEAVGSFPSLVFIPGPGLKTPYAHHVATGINGRLPWGMSIAGDFVFVRGLHQVGTLDYNPIVPALGSGRRPEDSVDPSSGLPMPGTSASILQQTSFGETWYRGFTLSLAKRKGGATQFLMSYTLSKAEDNTTDFQSAFIPENLGQGRNPSDPNGLPVGFDPNDERGPSLQDQRHRLVFSGQYVLPGKIQASSILTLASGRPYNILAGSDLNGDGNGGAFPPDRARRDPADPASSVMRNSGKLPGQATVDLRISRKFGVSEDVGTEVMLDMFNLFNRTNFTEINNIFGVGAFPDSPLATFGQFEAAGSPFQAQLGLRLRFK